MLRPPPAGLRARTIPRRRIVSSVAARRAASAGATSTVPVPRSSDQLDLRLPLGLPELPMPTEWKDQRRLWGHSLHPMCSYLASFPAALAHAFIARWSRPGDVVLDPFSGRGTTPLQACAEGRVGVGNRSEEHTSELQSRENLVCR